MFSLTRAQFRLNVKFRRHCILDERIVDVMFLIIVRAKSVCIVVKLADTDRSAAIERREYSFVPYRAVAANDAGSHELRLVALNQWREFVKTCYCRAGTRNDIEISYSKSRLNGVNVDRLQELSLKQFAYAGDIMPVEISDKHRKESDATSGCPDQDLRILQFP